jgi:haloalkane dehalogenase
MNLLRNSLSRRAIQAGVRRFPNLAPDRPEAEGAALSRRAREFLVEGLGWQELHGDWHEGPGSWGAAMQALRATIRNRPPPLELAEAGHFTQDRLDCRRNRI